MHIALWNEPVADFLTHGLSSGLVQADVVIERASRARCIELVRTDQVDLAMVPSFEAIRNVEDYDLLPAVALSSWGFPFARLRLREGLAEPPATLAFDPQYAQEVLLARTILREHYNASPRFVPYDDPSLEALLEAPEDGALLVDPDAALVRSDALLLDLGQEWYELANYPMVWALFATLRGHAVPEMVQTLRALAEAAEAGRALWLQARAMPAVLDQFYREEVRVRLDDLAVASLTEWRQYLFYYDVIEEVMDLPFFVVPEEDEEE